MILHQAQKEIAKDKHRFRVVNCGRRFGKTLLAIQEILGYTLREEYQYVAYIAPTYQQARDIAWEQLKKTAQPIIKKVNDSRLEMILNTKHGKELKIVLRGWESIETLRGQKFDFLVIDEIASMRNWVLNWQEVLRPTLTDTQGSALFISTPKGFNHFYDLYNKEKTDNDYKSFNYTSFNNPHIKKEEIEKARQEITEDRFAQEYLADFRKVEGLVYKEFDRKVHVIDDKHELPQFIETISGVDFGYTNPCAIITIKKDFDNCYWVIDEYYKKGLTDQEIAESCKQYEDYYKIDYFYPDPEAPEKIKVMKDKGLNCRDVIKGKDSVKTGISKVRELLKSKRLFINQKCENLIHEFEIYAYKEKKDLLNDPEEPIKENDHALDALRYALFSNTPTQTKNNDINFNLYNNSFN